MDLWTWICGHGPIGESVVAHLSLRFSLGGEGNHIPGISRLQPDAIGP